MTVIRQNFENWEAENLSKFAALSSKTKGRKSPEEPATVRTEFQKDRDKILHSLSFRLLKHKTQVFLSTSGEDFRTRLTHTLEVASIGRYIARALHLNEDLVEAIALGHDLGHTPFGHIGEAVLDELTPFKFEHSAQSVRVVSKLENNGLGLNLCYEVINGIADHSKGTISMEELKAAKASGKRRSATLEAEVVQYADWFAYINHDTDDAFNMGIITKHDVPESTSKVLGVNFQERLVTMLKDVIETSNDKASIEMSPGVLKATDELRDFLYNNVYNHFSIEERDKPAREVVGLLYNYYVEHYEEVLNEMPYLKDETAERGACDFVASLTDSRAMDLFWLKKHS